jgi:hypothetical protein
MSRACAAWLLAAALAAPPSARAADLRAEQIAPADAGELLLGGPDAIGGIGDWYLANDRVEIVVDDPSRRFGKLDHGGRIVDVGLRDRRGEDQFAELFPVVNMDQRVLVGYDAIRAEVDPEGRFARLVVTSPGLRAVARGGALARRFELLVPETAEIERVAVETEYLVRPGEAFVELTTTLENRGETPAPVFAWGDVWMRGGRSLRAFAVDTLDPSRSRGGQHRSFDRESLLRAGDAMAPFTLVAAAGLPAFPPIAYGLLVPERAAAGLRVFGVTDEHVSFANAFAADPGWPELTLLRLARALRSELAPGERFVFRRRLVVGDRADVAAATDLAFPMLGFADGRSGIEGAVAPAGMRCVVEAQEAASGAPLTQVEAAGPGPGAGRYRAVLPPGDYLLVFRAPARLELVVGVSVREGAFTAVPTVDLGGAAALVFAPAFADGGPGRVVVEGRDGTPDPVFDAELRGFRLDGRPAESATETRDLVFAGLAGDPERVELAPGRYRLTATRGLEWGVAALDVELAGPGSELRVPPFALARALELPGATSADLHVHAEASDDSGTRNEARIRSFLAEGVDVIAATDHDHLVGYGPTLAALGAGGRLRVIQGVEVTSSAPSETAPWTLGHHNAWPIPWRPLAPHGGAPPSQQPSVADLYASLRGEFGARVVQLNHPLGKRPGFERESFLTHLGVSGEPFDPELPLEAEPNRALLAAGADGRTRALDFDAIEVMNGRGFDQYRRTRELWYSLLRQGVRRTGTGNSDTHGPDEVAAYPRNYVLVPRDAGAEELDAALVAGRSFFTTGPLLLRFVANGAGPGETAAAPGGRLRVEIAVAAAPWVPVDELRLLVDGRVVRRWRDLAQPAEDPAAARFERTQELTLRRDVFLTLEAGAPLDAGPEAWGRERGGLYAATVAPGFVSQLVSNPIWVDVDGDGRVAPRPAAAAGLSEGALRRLFASSAIVLALALVWWRLRARARRAGLRGAPARR